MTDYSAIDFDRQAPAIFAYIDEPPFGIHHATQPPTGCDVEVARTILERLGVENIDTRLVTFPDLMPGVARGDWTINTPLFITADRSEIVKFTRPVWALPDGFIQRANSSTIYRNYSAIAQDETARIGCVRDQVQHQRAIDAGIPSDRISIFETQDAVIEALLDNQVDAYTATAMGHRAFIQREQDERLQVVDLVADDGTPMKAAFGGYSFAKDATGLFDVFNYALGDFLASTEYRTIMRRYGFADDEINQVISVE